jgi:hypothetical protein
MGIFMRAFSNERIHKPNCMARSGVNVSRHFCPFGFPWRIQTAASYGTGEGQRNGGAGINAMDETTT